MVFIVMGRGRCTQSQATFAPELFSFFRCAPAEGQGQGGERQQVAGAVVRFGCNLSTLLETLQLFGATAAAMGNTSVTLAYDDDDALFFVTLEEDGVVARCQICCLDASSDEDYEELSRLATAFRAEPVLLHTIIKSEVLKDAIAELSDVSNAANAVVSVTDNSKLFTLSASGTYGQCKVAYPSTSEAFVHFRLEEALVRELNAERMHAPSDSDEDALRLQQQDEDPGTDIHWTYPFAALQQGMRALNTARETFFRINRNGILCVQHLIANSGPDPCFVDFLMVAEEHDLLPSQPDSETEAMQQQQQREEEEQQRVEDQLREQQERNMQQRRMQQQRPHSYHQRHHHTSSSSSSSSSSASSSSAPAAALALPPPPMDQSIFPPASVSPSPGQAHHPYDDDEEEEEEEEEEFDDAQEAEHEFLDEKSTHSQREHANDDGNVSEGEEEEEGIPQGNDDAADDADDDVEVGEQYFEEYDEYDPDPPDPAAAPALAPADERDGYGDADDSAQGDDDDEDENEEEDHHERENAQPQGRGRRQTAPARKKQKQRHEAATASPRAKTKSGKGRKAGKNKPKQTKAEPAVPTPSRRSSRNRHR